MFLTAWIRLNVFLGWHPHFHCYISPNPRSIVWVIFYKHTSLLSFPPQSMAFGTLRLKPEFFMCPGRTEWSSCYLPLKSNLTPPFPAPLPYSAKWPWFSFHLLIRHLATTGTLHLYLRLPGVFSPPFLILFPSQQPSAWSWCLQEASSTVALCRLASRHQKRRLVALTRIMVFCFFVSLPLDD